MCYGVALKIVFSFGNLEAYTVITRSKIHKSCRGLPNGAHPAASFGFFNGEHLCSVTLICGNARYFNACVVRFGGKSACRDRSASLLNHQLTCVSILKCEIFIVFSSLNTDIIRSRIFGKLGTPIAVKRLTLIADHEACHVNAVKTAAYRGLVGASVIGKCFCIDQNTINRDGCLKLPMCVQRDVSCRLVNRILGVLRTARYRIVPTEEYIIGSCCIRQRTDFLIINRINGSNRSRTLTCVKRNLIIICLPLCVKRKVH